MDIDYEENMNALEEEKKVVVKEEIKEELKETLGKYLDRKWDE